MWRGAGVGGDRRGGGVEAADRVQPRPAPVERLDAGTVALDQGGGGHRAGGERVEQGFQGGVREVHRRLHGLRRRG